MVVVCTTDVHYLVAAAGPGEVRTRMYSDYLTWRNPPESETPSVTIH